VRTLSELKNNLSGRAKKEKKAILSNIFLLNNYHYILKTVKKKTEMKERKKLFVHV